MSSETEVGHAGIVASMVSAVRDGDLEKVKELLNEYGLSYCPSLVEGYILLCHAIDKKHLEIVKVLLDKGARVNCESNQTTQHLIKLGWDPEVRLFNYGTPSLAYNLLDKYTPLHLACAFTHSDWDQSKVVGLLVSSGAEVNAKAVGNETPLHSAATSGKAEIVETLLNHGAEVDCLELPNNYTPLHTACHQGHGAIVDMLLTRGADVNAKAKDGETALHIASDDCESEIAQILIKHGADVHCMKNSNNYTPLHEASASGSDAVNVLLENGADPNAKAVDNLYPLHLAAKYESVEAIKSLIRHGAQVNSPRLSDKYTPLHVACKELYEGGEVVCEILLEKGADPNIKANNNVTPMHLAAHRGHSEIVETLFKHGAEVNCTRLSDNYTPLLIACENRDCDVVDWLLSNGADPNALTSDNSNPLHLTVKEYDSEHKLCDTLKMRQDSDKIVKLLIEHGSHLNCRRSSDNYTPLHVASEALGGTKAVQLLLESGADPNMKTSDDMTPLHLAAKKAQRDRMKLLLKHGAQVNYSRLSDNCTPLHLACDYGSLEGASLLIDNGADPNAESNNNENPLHFVLENNCSPEKLCKYLIEQGTQVNCSRFSDNYTPLHVACSRVREKAVLELLKNGADPNAKAKNNITPLHLAVEEYDSDIVELLIKYGSQVDCTRLFDNKTPLYRACEEGKDTQVVVLLENGADPNHKANDGSTPLYAAISAEVNFSINLLKRLIKHGAVVNGSRLSDGYTPLHAACEMRLHRSFDVVDILLKNGADPNVSAHNSTTPLHLACKRGNYGTVDKLLSKSADINAKTCEGLTSLDLASQNNQDDSVRRCSIGPLQFKPGNGCLNLLKKHVILLKVAGLYVSEKNLHFIHEDDAELQAFRVKCEEEVEDMKHENVTDLFTVYDVLRYRQNPVYARSESLMESLKSFNYGKFPIYRSQILTCLERSKQRIEFLPTGQKALGALLKTCCVLNENKIRLLPVELQREIVLYFNNHELKSLVSFGEDLKHQFSKFSGNPGKT